MFQKSDQTFKYLKMVYSAGHIVFLLEWLDQSNFIDGYVSLDPQKLNWPVYIFSIRHLHGVIYHAPFCSCAYLNGHNFASEWTTDLSNHLKMIGRFILCGCKTVEKAYNHRFSSKYNATEAFAGTSLQGDVIQSQLVCFIRGTWQLQWRIMMLYNTSF